MVTDRDELALRQTVASASLDKTQRADPETSGDGPPVVIRRHQSSADERVLGQGDELGRYIVLGLLGAGAMGEVYTAYDPELDRRIAVKVIRRDDSAHRSRAATTRLVREAKSLARLSHPNVVTVYDVGPVKTGDVYIAMEHVAGVPLSEWIAKEERPWQRVVEVLVDAGRGLAAAHDAGLVHRDFKPDNLIIGVDGRPRVIDFGVAKQAADASGSVLPPAGKGACGELVGTPAYMAPEQLQGLDVGPAADQFAFAVALYQALEGRLPFAGNSLPELADNVIAGNLLEFSSESRTPRWVQSVIRRALSTAADERFPSMEALLSALSPSTSRRTIRWLAAALVLGTLAIISTTWFALDDRGAQRCTGFADQLSTVWNPSRQTALDSKLGSDVYARVSPRIEAYGRQWLETKEAACSATHHSGEQSTSVLQRRMECLDTRLRELDAVLAVIESSATSPQETLAALPSLNRCSNVAALSKASPPPSTLSSDDVEAIEDGLTSARALIAAGDYDDAGDKLGAAVEIIERSSWDGARAESLVVRGLLEMRRGEHRSSRETLFEAIRVAEKGSDAVDVAEAWVELVGVEAGGMERPAEAQRWAKHAAIAIEAAGSEQSLEARLAQNRAIAAARLEDHQAALADFKRARALFEHTLDPGHYRVALARADIGMTLRELGRLNGAERELRAALERLEALFGPDSPSLARVLNNLALVYRDSHDYPSARALLERSLEIKIQRLGRHHPKVATAYINLALLAQAEGNASEVERLWERSHEIRRNALGENHPRVIWSIDWKASYYLNLGRSQDALALAIDGERRRRAHVDEDSVALAGNLALQCEARRRMLRRKRARSGCEKARAMFERLGNESDKSLYPEIVLARISLDEGHIVAAEKGLERLHSRASSLGTGSVRERAHIDALAARIAIARGNRKMATTAAERARKGYERLGAGYRYYRDELEAALR